LAKQEAGRAFLFPPNPASVTAGQSSTPLYSAILFGPPGKSVKGIGGRGGEGRERRGTGVKMEM
jgi:hypothetical protein